MVAIVEAVIGLSFQKKVSTATTCYQHLVTSQLLSVLYEETGRNQSRVDDDSNFFVMMEEISPQDQPSTASQHSLRFQGSKQALCRESGDTLGNL